MARKPKTKWWYLRRVLLFGAVILLLLFLDSTGLAWKLKSFTGDSMDWKSHYLAGLRSTNCGRVEVRQDPSKASACALKAHSEGRAFRVIYNIQGYDSTVAGGIIRTADGRILAISFVGCPMGCGFSFLAQKANVQSCPQPYHLYTNPKGRLNCFRPQLSYPASITSENAEPY